MRAVASRASIAAAPIPVAATDALPTVAPRGLRATARTAVVVLTWNDLALLKQTLRTFGQFNRRTPTYVVDSGSIDGTAKWLAGGGYRLIRHPINLGIFRASLDAWERAASAGYEFILNLQSDFPCTRAAPFEVLEEYLDANPQVGFIRLNRWREMRRNCVTHEPIVAGPAEALRDGWRIVQYNYHMSFHPYLFRANIVAFLKQAWPRTERGLMRQYEKLGLRGAKLQPACFSTIECNRHGTPGWRH